MSEQQVYTHPSQEELLRDMKENEGGPWEKKKTGLNDVIAINTGEFTGRSPKDRFIVENEVAEHVDWGEINKPFETAAFDTLKQSAIVHIEQHPEKYISVHGAGNQIERPALVLTLISTSAPHTQFAYNMFLPLTHEEYADHPKQWMIYHAPEHKADEEMVAETGLRQGNGVIVNFETKEAVIMGTGYTGEIKKIIFAVLNYTFPEQGILPMHCSANVNENGDVAVFFGLSGTGKTTLSSEEGNPLIGDDEHGRDDAGVFNFEGGCYAKCIDLDPEKEPGIYDAIKDHALLENIGYKENSNMPDFSNIDTTPNTRVSYSLDNVENKVESGRGKHPKDIFFLTCDAQGILPPISKLTPEQAREQFLLGYTSKVAGTEQGITDPESTFSACFGEPFMPRHVTEYGDLLTQKIEDHGVNVWLVNTGWRGPYGNGGERMKLAHTRAMVAAARNRELDDIEYREDPYFGFQVPTTCPSVDENILSPETGREDIAAYEKKAGELSALFEEKLEKIRESR